MMKAKNNDLMMPHQINHSTNIYCKPYSKSTADMMPPNQHVAKAPMMPAKILNVTKKGMVVTMAQILGRIR